MDREYNIPRCARICRYAGLKRASTAYNVHHHQLTKLDVGALYAIDINSGPLEMCFFKMNPIDAYSAQVFSSLASHHPRIDWYLLRMSSNHFLKGQIVMLIFWGLWFYPGPQRDHCRRVLVSALLACVLALGVGRVLVWSLPPRVRPINNSAYHFDLRVPVTFEGKDASSFPSDHAVLFFALATGIFLADKRIGALALGYVSAFVCFPRLWLGYHYFTDILVGALIGAGVVLLLNLRTTRSAIGRLVLGLLDVKPHFVYMGLFLFSYQVSEMFDSVRDLLAAVHPSIH